MRRLFPDCEALFMRRGWALPSGIDRVYISDRAISGLSWTPQYNFHHVLRSLRADEDFRSPLARAVGSKGYHATLFEDGPCPVG